MVAAQREPDAPAARAHNPDTSYTRIRVADHDLDLEFLFDLETLGRLGELDVDLDDRITQLELKLEG